MALASAEAAAEALVAVGVYEDQLEQPAVFIVNDQTYELDPNAVGLQVTTEAAVAEALQQRQGGLVSGFAPWMRSFGEAIDIPLEVTVDGNAIDANLARWEADAVAEPAFEGAVMVVSGSVEHEYPRDGLALDLDASHDIVETTLLATERTTQELPLL